MMKFAAASAGFQSGLLKAAATRGYDNQPGPHPGAPAPPDSHRKRNVALAAAVLGGGMLGTKKLYSMGGQMAQANRSAMAQGIGAAARRSVGNPQQMAAVRQTASKFQQLRKSPITVGERGRALSSAAGQQFDQAKTRIGAARDRVVGQYKANRADALRKDMANMRDAGLQRELARAESNLPPAAAGAAASAAPAAPGKLRNGVRRAGRYARNAALGATILAGGAVAGGSAASRANEQEDARSPGA